MKRKNAIKKKSTRFLTTRNIGLALLLLLVAAIINPVIGKDTEIAAGTPFWVWSFLGRLHPLIVHFPIGLLVVAWLMELLVWKRKSNDFGPAIRVLMVIGTISSVIAVVFGLLLINTEEYGGDILPLHQWTGIATMVLAAITTYAYFRKSRRMQKLLLTLTVVGVTVAGHYGASITHGEDYLTSVLPSAQPDVATNQPTFVLANQTGPLNETQVQELNLQIRSIFAHSCTNCHGEAKQ